MSHNQFSVEKNENIRDESEGHCETPAMKKENVEEGSSPRRRRKRKADKLNDQRRGELDEQENEQPSND